MSYIQQFTPSIPSVTISNNLYLVEKRDTQFIGDYQFYNNNTQIVVNDNNYTNNGDKENTTYIGGGFPAYPLGIGYRITGTGIPDGTVVKSYRFGTSNPSGMWNVIYIDLTNPVEQYLGSYVFYYYPPSVVPSYSTIPSSTIIPSESNIPSSSIVPSESNIPSFTIVPSESNIPSSSIVPSNSNIPSSSIVPSESNIPYSISLIPSNSNIPSSSIVPSSSLSSNFSTFLLISLSFCIIIFYSNKNHEI
jgi:hypothetical protein